MRLRDVLKNGKRYLPEILTFASIGGIGLGDYFLITGIKEDNKKKKILGGTFHVGSAVAIVASNRLSNTQKVSLLATSVAATTKLTDYKEVVQQVTTPQQFEQIEKIFNKEELEKLMIEADEADEFIDDCLHRKTVYYFSQLHRIVQCDPDSMSVALLNVNTTYTMYGRASVNDFLRWIPNIESKEEDYDFGWACYDEDPESGDTAITINQYSKPTRNGVDVTYIWFNESPLRFDEWQDYYECLFKKLDDWYKDDQARIDILKEEPCDAQ